MTSALPATRVTLTPRAAEIATVARELLESEGLASLSMRNIAARLGIRAASLYEHFADKRAVEDAIIAAGLYEQGDHIAIRVARTDGEPIPAIAEAFREWAKAHPSLYKLIMQRDLDRDAPDVAAAELHAGACIREACWPYREMSLSFWAFAHGLVDLELNERFPPGFDYCATWSAGLNALQSELGRLRAENADPSHPTAE